MVPVPVPVPVPVSTFQKVTVPVPVPGPYLDHKKQIFQKKFGIFTRKKFINFNKFMVKCE